MTRQEIIATYTPHYYAYGTKEQAEKVTEYLITLVWQTQNNVEWYGDPTSVRMSFSSLADRLEDFCEFESLPERLVSWDGTQQFFADYLELTAFRVIKLSDEEDTIEFVHTLEPEVLL